MLCSEVFEPEFGNCKSCYDIISDLIKVCSNLAINNVFLEVFYILFGMTIIAGIIMVLYLY